MGAFAKQALLLATGALFLCSCDGGDTLFLRNQSKDTAFVTLYNRPVVLATGDTLRPSGIPLHGRPFFIHLPDGSSPNVWPEEDSVNNAISFVVLPGSRISILHRIGFSGGHIDDWGFNAIVTRSRENIRIYSDSAMLEITTHKKHFLGLSDYYIDVMKPE